MAKIHLNDVGLVITVDLGEALAGATGLSLVATKPDGVIVTWTPTISGNGLVYTTIANDLDVPGLWRLHPSFTLGGWVGHGDVVSFQVHSLYVL